MKSIIHQIFFKRTDNQITVRVISENAGRKNDQMVAGLRIDLRIAITARNFGDAAEAVEERIVIVAIVEIEVVENMLVGVNRGRKNPIM